MTTAKREILTEIDNDFLFADGLDNAIIGYVSASGRPDVVLYDYEKVITILMADMSREEAEEYCEYNIQSAHFGEMTPAFATLIEPTTPQISTNFDS